VEELGVRGGVIRGERWRSWGGGSSIGGEIGGRAKKKRLMRQVEKLGGQKEEIDMIGGEPLKYFSTYVS
jgi:hypothetical protein